MWKVFWEPQDRAASVIPTEVPNQPQLRVRERRRRVGSFGRDAAGWLASFSNFMVKDGMASILSNQERRILAAARQAGVAGPDEGVNFDWRQAAQAAGMPAEEAAATLKGLRRFGYVSNIGRSQAHLTKEGATALSAADHVEGG
jgi:hypothetical protein